MAPSELPKPQTGLEGAWNTREASGFEDERGKDREPPERRPTGGGKKTRREGKWAAWVPKSVPKLAANASSSNMSTTGCCPR